MVLVDTSVWVDHLHYNNRHLAGLLNDARVMCHPFIIGELACGNLSNRKEVLALLNNLPQVSQVKPEEVLYFIENYQLMGKGLGYIDIHLAASARVTGVVLWTLDKRLDGINEKLGISYRVKED
jgi:predicted nucleic acid-binding protein